MKKRFSLKDALFNAEKVTQLSSEIKAVYPAFDAETFIKKSLQAFPELELKARIEHLCTVLYETLPKAYDEATEIIEKALPKELDTNKYDNDFGDFIYAPYASYIARYGCRETVLEGSFLMLRALTKRFSVEFAIRDFLNAFPEETMEMLEACAHSENYHERRLASEGSRPKLPWAKKLTLHYRKALPVLETLFYDKTRYVTRSVANHLNDISKIDAALVLKTLRIWNDSGKQERKEMDYILSHALRTLVKEGNPEALALLGYKQRPNIIVSDLELSPEKVHVGESIDLSCHIEAEECCRLMIDYIIHFRTKQGKRSLKVHKLKKLTLKEGDSVNVGKNHLFKANMTTRKLYAGEHKVEMQINGARYNLGSFMLY